ncbi:MobA/MobL family protein [Novosphingobium taihuense]|uniref:ElaB/YqjD/DUF883 family membrane-anchored ribosome-binding protein n=1 Tax=Novosphingobium taihuense TaxID=260085 RepID=A0A7W7AG46_9SPHN|nr:MobA/MobL family protein [Novosphingobium taihuense]MBB4615402.1 ElaB/YqjD/DUF883 family membrane-anchored ribosome-binding protein [Novosphingobium taihuense]
MGGSLISNSVKAANSKLAQMLRTREEDEALLQIGKRKIKDQAAREADYGGRVKKARRWSQKADFSYPSPLVDRPRTAAGSTSFHFSYTTISKEGSPEVRGKPMANFGGASRVPGADHAAYVERDGAAEMSRGAEHAQYVERPGAIEHPGRERTPDDVGEGLLPDEQAVLGPVGNGIFRSVFSNISSDRFEREEYWRAVHRCEREAKTHSLIVDPSHSPAWWAALETTDVLPADFKSHCIMQADRYRVWLANEANDPKAKPFIAHKYKRSARGCGEAIEAAQSMPGWDFHRPPLTFKSGRGGRVQLRLVAELPCELNAEDRALIVQNFTDYLASFARDREGRTVGLMYTAVIHAPDAHNDRRNYHLHIIAHSRPAKFLADFNAWDFEVTETYKDPGSRKDRVRHPFRQNKIGEVERKLADGKPNKHAYYNNDIAGGDFIPHLRRKFAEINNAVLMARGIQRRLDPRRYQEMGISRTATEHLGTRAAALEAMGVPTVIGRLNAIAIWSDAERAIRDRAKAVQAQLASTQNTLRGELDEALKVAPDAPETARLRRLTAERDNLVSTIADDRLELMIFDHLEAKAKSRAVRTRQACLQTLTEAQRVPGTHSKDTVRAIERRYGEAQAHIEKVDHALSFDRPRIAAAAAEVLKREQRIQQIDRELATLRISMQAVLEQSRAYQARAKARKAKREAEAAAEAERKRLADLQAKPAQSQVTPPVAKPTAVPVANTPSPTTVAQPAAAPSMTTPSAKMENDHGRRPERNPALHLAYWRAITARELVADGIRLLQRAPSLGRLPGLSSIPMVRDAERPPVLLQHLQDAHLGGRHVRHQEGPGDGMRRPGVGDHADAGSAGEGSGTDVAGSGKAAPTPPQPLAPPAIGGVPIVEPVLPVTSDAVTPPALPEAGDPEGLQPLRPQPVEQAPQVKAEPVDLASSESDQSAQPADQQSSLSQSGERIDKRRKVEDPTLFPVSESVAPKKPGTPKATYEDWDALVSTVSRNRIPVSRKEDPGGKVRYLVPSLDEADAALISNARFAARSASRLAAIFEQQDLEISRLIRWIEMIGQDPKALIIEGRSARIGKATDSISGLLNAWGKTERVKNALRAEKARRDALAATAESSRQDRPERSGASLNSPASASPTNQARLAELARIYPDPADGKIAQTRHFIKLLREDAPPEELRKAAEAISIDAVAREDVYRHRVELAMAYEQVMEDDGDAKMHGSQRGFSRN